MVRKYYLFIYHLSVSTCSKAEPINRLASSLCWFPKRRSIQSHPNKMPSFNRYYETWFDHLHSLVHQLAHATNPPTTQDHYHQLDHLVQQLMSHYSEYYRIKSVESQRDVLSIFAAPWITSLERSLLWITGWRPSTIFHLLYTESSIHFESHIFDILHGFRSGDLGDLSLTQFRQVNAQLLFVS
ncbi:DOG1 domain-containing protein [Cephalotus follicularis]|uniref:DOG1 domain-containing protein n=1 Tax=Cephalotus follicularis TaxID=3775 RepID=A0A1Q3AY85_CEPFO|nr:DOG1 domain-containing protein [Cephalotus follicularis]